ncbi:hypothetical protein HQ520_14720, partial [bacterium]|nr:hypothetical protein [bacterium]
PLLIVLVVALLIIGLIVMFYGREIGGGMEIVSLARDLTKFQNETIPALERDFPFDAALPPLFDEDLFQRYCRVRDTVGRQLQPALPRIQGLIRERDEGKPNARAAFRGLNDVGPQLRVMLATYGTSLRANQMSPDLFQYAASQSWGAAALAYDRKDPKSVGLFQEMVVRAHEWMGGETEQDVDTFVKNVYDEVEPHLILANPYETWDMIVGSWTEWTNVPEAFVVDILARFDPADLQKQLPQAE